MLCLPEELRLLQCFAPAFTDRTYQRFVLLAIGTIVAMGRRTVSRVLWTVRFLLDGHPSSYHRFFSQAVWSLWPLGRILCALVLACLPADDQVLLSADDTLARHGGKKVWGKACHRDAVRSSHRHTHFAFGHKWVTLAIHLPIPFTGRMWALPVLVALCPPAPKQNKKSRKGKGGKTRKASKSGRRAAGGKAKKPTPRHKTQRDLARQLLALLIHWFPQRRFLLLCDWGISNHELAWFCFKHRRHVTLISRIRCDAHLHAMPPRTKRPGPGRRARKGARLASPKQTLAQAQPWRRSVRWYGNSQREVELFSACGGWYRGRGGGRAALVPIRWVWVHELEKGRQDWFYSTDPTLDVQQIVELYAARWSIELTFEEVRAHLGFETTRQRKKQSVLRTAPCLLGLYSVVSLIYRQLHETQGPRLHQTPCYAKTEATFADALYAVRRVLWPQVILSHLPDAEHVTKLPPRLKEALLDYLAEAA